VSMFVFYSLSNVCQFFKFYPLFVLCHCALLSSTVCLLSVIISQCTVCWICVSFSTAVLFSLCTVSQYLTLYLLLVLCLCVHCCLLQSVHCLSVPQSLQSVGSMSLFTPLSYSFCPLSPSIFHCIFCWFCVTVFIALF
jgi:hypothetical protein